MRAYIYEQLGLDYLKGNSKRYQICRAKLQMFIIQITHFNIFQSTILDIRRSSHFLPTKYCDTDILVEHFFFWMTQFFHSLAGSILYILKKLFIYAGNLYLRRFLFTANIREWCGNWAFSGPKERPYVKNHNRD